jgi:hypothetical protein
LKKLHNQQHFQLNSPTTMDFYIFASDRKRYGVIEINFEQALIGNAKNGPLAQLVRAVDS